MRWLVFYIDTSIRNINDIEEILLSSTTTFKCFHDIWSGSRANKLLHLLIALLNSSLEKGSQSMVGFIGNSFKKLWFIGQFWAELNVWCKACYNSLSSMQGCLLYHNNSIANSFCFLIQFMKSYSPLFLDIISWILSSKNKYLVFFTIPLKVFQSSVVQENLYLVSLSLHFSFHHLLKCLVILIHGENLY